MSQPSEAPPVLRLSWDEFRRWFIEAWEFGEHVSLIGPTGQGKSHVALALLAERARRRGTNIVMFGTKPADATVTRHARRAKWPRIKTWPPNYGDKQVILWPEYGDIETVRDRQARIFRPALQQIFAEGKRIVYFDEVADLEDRLGFRDIVDEFWRMARSNNLSLVAGTQRPVGVNRHMFASPTWLFLWRSQDEDELRRLGEIGGGIDKRRVREIVGALPKHEFLCVNTRTGEMAVSKLDLPTKGAMTHATRRDKRGDLAIVARDRARRG